MPSYNTGLGDRGRLVGRKLWPFLSCLGEILSSRRCRAAGLCPALDNTVPPLLTPTPAPMHAPQC